MVPKKVYSIIFAFCAVVLLTMPAYAAEPTATPAPTPAYTDDDILNFGGSIGDAMGETGNALSGIMGDIQELYAEIHDDMVQVSDFFAYTLGGIIDLLPVSFTVFLIMFSVLLVLVAILHVLAR